MQDANKVLPRISFPGGQPPRKRSGVRGIDKEAGKIHGDIYTSLDALYFTLVKPRPAVNIRQGVADPGKVPLLLGMLHKTPRHKDNKTRIHRGRR